MAEPFSIATWNVNSLRVRLEAVQAWLQAHQPTVLCLQETKLTDDQFPEDALKSLGYSAAYVGQKTYNGVAILSKRPMTDVRIGFDGNDAEPQKRLIAATVDGVRVVNAYIPNGGQVGSDNWAYKLDFLERMTAYFADREHPGQRMVFVGDFNVAPEPRDVYDPEALEGSTCYHREERLRLEVVRRWGFLDLFRRVEYGDGHYSWWDFRTNAWPQNHGLRIDHVWATLPLASALQTCSIEKAERGKERASDHAPVLASFQID